MNHLKFYNPTKFAVKDDDDFTIYAALAPLGVLTDDNRGTMFAEDAFDKFLKNKPVVRMFYQHEASNPIIGKWVDFKVQDNMLYAKGIIFKDSQYAADIYVSVKEKMLSGVSVGLGDYTYEIVNNKDEDEYLVFKDITLREASLVHEPAFDDAEITEYSKKIISRNREDINNNELNEFTSKMLDAVKDIFEK